MTGIAQKILANPESYSIAMLTKGVQDGVIPAYIGIPLIQQKTKDQAQASGMQGAQQAEQPPIAEQILAQAQQAGGVDNLPSNLPTQSYAPGGIVAFAEGSTTPIGRWYDQTKAGASQWYDQAREEGDKMMQARKLRESLYDQYRPATGVSGLFTAQTDAERKAAQDVISKLPNLSLEQLQELKTRGPSALITNRPGQMTTANDPRVASASPATGTPSGDTAALGIDQLIKNPTAPATSGTGISMPNIAAPATSPFVIPPAPKVTRGKGMFDLTTERLADEESKFAKREQLLQDDLEKGKPTGTPLEDYKKSLEAEALQAGADREQARGMAIFKAGLAMMAGTSQHALENIGKGAMVGAEDWQVANRELKKAQKERQKELAYVAQAERAEARDDWKSAQQFRSQAAERKAAQDRFGTTAVLAAQGKDLDLGTKDAEIASQQWSTVAQVGASMRNADVQAATSRYSSELGAAATMGAAREHGEATRYAADTSASSRLLAAELKADLAKAAAEGKGGLSQNELIKWRNDYASHPEVQAFKKQLIDQYGKNVEGKPEFQQALAQKIDQILARDATRNIGNGPSINPDDMALIKKYSATK